MLLLVGAPFLCVGLWEMRETQQRLDSQSIAQGTVIDNDFLIHTDPEDSSRSSGAFHPVVRFSTERGQKVVFTDGVGTYPAKYESGETVKVLYDPQDPSEAMVLSWSNLWLASAIFAAVGLIPIGIALVLSAVSLGLFTRRSKA
jgi:hypothetical protein